MSLIRERQEKASDRKMDRLTAYIQESIQELLYKVTWPTWDELWNSTILVLVSSIILSLSIFAMDFFVGSDPRVIYGQEFGGVLYWVYNLIFS